jgi:hypothetical protein
MQVGHVNESIVILLRASDKADWVIDGRRNEAGEVQKVLKDAVRLKEGMPFTQP